MKSTKKKMNKNNFFINLCVIITITIVLIALLEIGSAILVKIASSIVYKNQEMKDYDVADSEMINFVATEDRLVEAKYAPYVGFLPKDMKGKYVNIVENKRYTENNCDSSNNLEIWVFGGSTVFGSAVADSQTIPSLISKKLCEKGLSVNVTNYGQIGYTSTQDMVTYILELKKKDAPDIAIFYTGYNDVFATNQNGMAGSPQNEFKRNLEFNSWDKTSVSRIIVNSNTMKIIRKVIGAQDPLIGWKVVAPEEKTNSLILQTEEVYLENFYLTKALSENKGTEFYFFFQPSLYSKENISTKENEYYEAYKNFLNNKESYERIANDLDLQIKELNFINLVNLFDDEQKTVFLDAIHVSSYGNNKIADSIVSEIAD